MPRSTPWKSWTTIMILTIISLLVADTMSFMNRLSYHKLHTCKISLGIKSTRRVDVKMNDENINDSGFNPPIINDDICLMPGEPLVRVETAPGNARRIFTGIDILRNVDAVWKVLTKYDSLHKVVPSLVKNEVLELYPDGAKLLQIGSAKVLPGITFTAKTVLEIRTYLEDSPISEECIANYLQNSKSPASSHDEITNLSQNLPLRRGVFPRPYAITTLPHRDITMQNVIGEGDFDFYQGIWRVQPLPNCAPDGKEACRLTYAVEIRPKGFLPVALIENRIASDLNSNLKAIRNYVEKLPEEVVQPVTSDRLSTKGTTGSSTSSAVSVLEGTFVAGGGSAVVTSSTTSTAISSSVVTSSTELSSTATSSIIESISSPSTPPPTPTTTIISSTDTTSTTTSTPNNNYKSPIARANEILQQKVNQLEEKLKDLKNSQIDHNNNSRL